MKILFSILAFAVLVGVLIVPISAVTSYAYEDDEPTVIDGDTHEQPIVINIPDTLKFYPVVTVGTSAGSYTTATSPFGVYSYLVSNNNPKASTRSPTYSGTPMENGSYTISTAMIFKNHSGGTSTENNFTFDIEVFDDFLRMMNEGDGYLTDPAHLSYYTDMYFVFSNGTNIDVSVTNLSTNNSISSSRTFTLTQWVPSSTPVYIYELLEDIWREYTFGDFADHGITTKIRIKVDSANFSGSNADSSYVKIFSPAVTHSEYYNTYNRVVNYVQDTAGWYDWQNFLGYQSGYSAGNTVGYNRGYEEGYTDGQSNAETSAINPGWFVSGVDAFLGIRLFQYDVLDKTYDFTLGSIFTIALGGTALIWFLKIFAGG